MKLSVILNLSEIDLFSEDLPQQSTNLISHPFTSNKKEIVLCTNISGGKFAGISATQLIVDCNGVGFDVNISLYTFSKLKDLTEGKVYIHLSVKEDAHVLYGFADEDERKMFRQLITVSGIGTNTARVILSSMNPAELQQNILNGNAPLLQKIKGIGNKTAQRIIIDLRDKVGKESINDVTFISTPGNTIKNEALSALLVLGFARPNAEKALEGILKRGGETKVEQLIKRSVGRIVKM